MRVFPQLATLLISLLISLTQVHGQTQAAMNAHARAEFEQADAELNKTYEALLAKLPDAEGKEKLKQSQRGWLAFRDAEAAFAADQARGGSMAPTIRYETITELTQQRIKQPKARHTDDAAPHEKDASTPSPTPTATSSASAQESNKEPAAAAPNPSSVSPDKKWEYKCAEYGLDQCAPEIVKAGTADVVLDLDQEQQVHGPEARHAEVIWAPDSKRFAFNYSPLHAHHTTYETVAFYQLRGDKWVAMHSPVDEESERAQLVQLAKDHLPKSFNPRHCDRGRDVLKLREWIDANTAILYAPCYARSSGELESAFLFTLNFNDAGNCKIIKTHQLSKKELEDEQ